MSDDYSEDNFELDQTIISHTKEEEKKEYNQRLEEKLTKQIAKGGGITVVGQTVGKGLKFLFQILLTRVLGANAYGLYALGVNVLGISQTFSQLGLQNGVVRFGSIYRGEGNEARLKGTIIISLGFPFLAGLIAALFLFVFADFIATAVFQEPELTSILKIFAVSLPFYTLMTVTAFSARIFRQMQYDVGLRLILHPIVLIICTGISFLIGYRLLGVIYGFLISTILAAAIGIRLLWKIFPDLISDLNPQFEVKGLVYFSLTLLLVGLSSILIFRMDRIMLGILSAAEDVGIYNAATVMAGQATIFLGSFNAIFAPIISDLHNKDKMVQLSSLFKTTTKWIFTLTLPIFLIFTLFPSQIMGIFGPEFKIGWLVLIGLGLAQLLNAIVGSSGLMLTMSGNQKVELINNLILGSLNILLNLLLIPKLGILGAAIATGGSIGLVNLAKLLEVYIIKGVHPYKRSYWKPIMAGLVASLLFVAINSTLKLQGPIWVWEILAFMVVYIVLLFLLGLDKEDKLVLRAIVQKLLTME